MKRGILSGLLIGDTSKITEETKEDFRTSSLTHILAVSGSHVIYLTIALTYLTKFTKINKRISNLILIIILVIFMFVTGFTASVVRACIMGIIVIVGKLLYRKPDIINSISLSLLIILIYNPFWIKDVGLILSYGGVLGIIIFYRKILALFKTKNKIKEILAVSISAQIIIIPIMILFFNTLSLTFFIPNLLVTPLIGIAMLLRIYKFIFTNYNSNKAYLKYNNLNSKNFC